MYVLHCFYFIIREFLLEGFLIRPRHARVAVVRHHARVVCVSIRVRLTVALQRQPCSYGQHQHAVAVAAILEDVGQPQAVAQVHA